MLRKNVKALLTAAAVMTASASLQAAALNWNGSDADWNAAANWSDGAVSRVPLLNAGTDTATISAGTVTYPAGIGDWSNNSTLTVSGTGKWVQAAIPAWIKLGNGAGQTGNLTVTSGGTFDTGGSTGFMVGYNGSTGNISLGGAGSQVLVRTGMTLSGSSTVSITGGDFKLLAGGLTQSTGSVTVIGGTLSMTGGYVFSGGSYNQQGGAVTIASTSGEFNPNNNMSMSGGSITVGSLISFNNGAITTAHLDISGGRINVVNGASWGGGIYSIGGDRFINFTEGSTGEYFAAGATLATIADLGQGVLNSGKIRYNGVTNASKFTVSQYTDPTLGAGVLISPVSVPEPVGFGLVAGLAATTLRRRRA